MDQVHQNRVCREHLPSDLTVTLSPAAVLLPNQVYGCLLSNISFFTTLTHISSGHVLVQWPELHERYPRTQYIGKLA